jgi:hypothetical protein
LLMFALRQVWQPLASSSSSSWSSHSCAPREAFPKTRSHIHLRRCHIRTAVSEACLSLYCPYPCRKEDSLTGMELSILGEAQIEQGPRLLGKQAIERVCLGPPRCCAWVVLWKERENIRASLLPLWAAVPTLCDARKIRSFQLLKQP